MTSPLAIVVLALFSPQARSHESPLRGLAKLDLVIENFDSEAINCGITKEGIRRAIMNVASDAKFQISDVTETYMYVATSTLFFKSVDACATTLTMQVIHLQDVVLDFSGREATAAIELWSHIVSFSDKRANHGQQYLQAIEVLTKRFITDWNLANK